MSVLEAIASRSKKLTQDGLGFVNGVLTKARERAEAPQPQGPSSALDFVELQRAGLQLSQLGVSHAAPSAHLSLYSVQKSQELFHSQGRGDFGSEFGFDFTKENLATFLFALSGLSLCMGGIGLAYVFLGDHSGAVAISRHSAQEGWRARGRRQQVEQVMAEIEAGAPHSKASLRDAYRSLSAQDRAVLKSILERALHPKKLAERGADYILTGKRLGKCPVWMNSADWANFSNILEAARGTQASQIRPLIRMTLEVTILGRIKHQVSDYNEHRLLNLEGMIRRVQDPWVLMNSMRSYLLEGGILDPTTQVSSSDWQSFEEVMNSIKNDIKTSQLKTSLARIKTLDNYKSSLERKLEGEQFVEILSEMKASVRRAESLLFELQSTDPMDAPSYRVRARTLLLEYLSVLQHVRSTRVPQVSTGGERINLWLNTQGTHLAALRPPAMDPMKWEEMCLGDVQYIERLNSRIEVLEDNLNRIDQEMGARDQAMRVWERREALEPKQRAELEQWDMAKLRGDYQDLARTRKELSFEIENLRDELNLTRELSQKRRFTFSARRGHNDDDDSSSGGTGAAVISLDAWRASRATSPSGDNFETLSDTDRAAVAAALRAEAEAQSVANPLPSAFTRDTVVPSPVELNVLGIRFSLTPARPVPGRVRLAL